MSIASLTNLKHVLFWWISQHVFSKLKHKIILTIKIRIRYVILLCVLNSILVNFPKLIGIPLVLSDPIRLYLCLYIQLTWGSDLIFFCTGSTSRILYHCVEAMIYEWEMNLTSEVLLNYTIYGVCLRFFLNLIKI